VETDGMRMCELLVGLPTVTVLGVVDEHPDVPGRGPECSWTELAPQIPALRLVLTDQVGRHGRPVSEVANAPRCDWHTVTAAVIADGTSLVDDPARVVSGNRTRAPPLGLLRPSSSSCPADTSTIEGTSGTATTGRRPRATPRPPAP
jgi:hypothetical protein